MSGSTTTPSGASSTTIWGAPIVSVLAYGTFLAAIIIAMIVKNNELLVTLCGVAGANATTAVSFWLGSSKGSQDKDAKIATMTPSPPPGTTTTTATAPIGGAPATTSGTTTGTSPVAQGGTIETPGTSTP